MIVTYWGVRGSMPAPGPDTVRYGGNTACVSVEIGGRMLIIDAGTGIRALGDFVESEPRQVFVVLSHLHADHLGGLPFFAPLFRSDAPVCLVDFEHADRSFSLVELFDGVHVPVPSTRLSSSCCCISQETAFRELASDGVDVRTIPLNHPGGAVGYRVAHDGAVFVHLTDNELQMRPPRTRFEEFADFCRGADVLSHDAQWVDSDLDARAGWGHSSVSQACDLAIAAGVRQLVLFHHDPARTDDAIDVIQAGARRRLEPHGIRCTAAYEGLRIDLANRPTETSASITAEERAGLPEDPRLPA